MRLPVVVERPSARYLLIEVLADWGDLDFQRRHWIDHEYVEFNVSNPYDDSYHLEDVCAVSPEALNARGHCLATSDEEARVQAFVDAYEPFEESDVIDWRTYVDMVNHPTWHQIVELCRSALALLVLGGGTITPDTLSSRRVSVGQPHDRHLVATALASIAEASYRKPGEYTAHDAPAYLVAPEQAIKTLLTVGGLEDPRAQIGALYRPSYQELRRLEALHDSVVRYQAGEITLTDLVDPAVDALCSIIRSGAGWDLDADELASARRRATTPQR